MRSIFLLALLTAPSMADAGTVRVSSSASTELVADTFVCVPVTKTVATEVDSRPFPDQFHALKLKATFTGLSAETNITWVISPQSDCEAEDTDEAEVAVLDRDGDGNGSANSLIGTGFVVTDEWDTAQTLYVGAILDAGISATTVVFRITWEVTK